MDNQHRKISGYRELTQDEIEMMNGLKHLEAQCLAAQKRVMQHLSHQEEHGTPEDKKRLQDAYAHRWAQIGKTEIEQGFMALIRAVAQPQPRGE